MPSKLVAPLPDPKRESPFWGNYPQITLEPQSNPSLGSLFKGAVEAHSVEDVISLAATKGVELTQDDFVADAADTDRELDEAELEAVAGGGFWSTTGGEILCGALLMLSIALGKD